MTTITSDALSSTVRRTRLLWTPVLVFLTAQVVGPLTGELAVSPLVRADAYAFNERVLQVGTMVAVFLGTMGVTWWMTRLEGAPRGLALTHLRQSSLVYAYALVEIGFQRRDALSSPHFACYVCPMPWFWIVPAALVGNLVGVSIARISPVAA